MAQDQRERKEELRQIAQSQMPNPVITMAYMEHYLDLVSKLVKDLSGLVDPTLITPEIQERLSLLDQILPHSSIDFENLSSPLENYKIPQTALVKQEVSSIRNRYLQVQVDEGLL